MSDSMTENEGPRFAIEVAGETLNQAEPKGVTSFFVEDHVDMMGVLKVTISQTGLEWSTIKMGDPATASFGGNADKVFNGLITGLRHHQHKGGMEYVTIIAMDPLCKLGSSRHTKVYEEQSDSDIVSAVLGAAGVSAGTVDSTSGTNKYVIQRNESDLMFLKRLAARNGYLLLGDKDGKVEFTKAQFSGSPIELAREDLIEFDYTVSHQTIPPSLTVYGWSYVDKKKVEGTASSGDVDTIGGGKNAVKETGVIWQDDAYVSDVQVADQGAAKAMAIAELNRLARQFVRGRAKVKGTGEIHAGVLVKFKSFATGFNP